MKKITLLFSFLLLVFLVIWGIKLRTPINRPQDISELEQTAWFSRYSAPQAASEWVLDEEVPDNYIPVPGQNGLYMVTDDGGKIIGYMARTIRSDGSSVWAETNPDIPEDYTLVKGLKDVYRVKNEDGTKSYFKYVRNDDDTFAFVPVDKKGNPLDDKADAGEIDEQHYIHEKDNIYAKYDDNGVLIGYRERIETEDGAFVWRVTDMPQFEQTAGNMDGFSANADASGQPDEGNGQQADVVYAIADDAGTKTENNNDGTYEETTTTYNTETVDGVRIMYKTVTHKIFTQDGVLVESYTEGPTQVSKEALSVAETPDTSKIAVTLDGELSRVTSQASMDASLAAGLMSELNADRVAQGLSAVSQDNGDLYKIACIRAADMAIYDHQSASSPMYGSIDDLMLRYQVSGVVSENVMRTSKITAKDINKVMMSNSTTKALRMSDDISKVAIAAAYANNQYYIVELYE